MPDYEDNVEIDCGTAAEASGQEYAMDCLQEEIESLRKDATRYRFMRENMNVSPRDLFNAWWLSEHGWPENIDKAIDAAMEAK